jgi:hypothetical protein
MSRLEGTECVRSRAPDTCLAVALLALLPLPARAQSLDVVVKGKVSDDTGASLPGATVTVTEIDTNIPRTVTSSEQGVYTAPSLSPGMYRVQIERSGFKPVRREGIRLSTGEKARVDLSLAVGDVREEVTVTADAPIVRVETASLGTVIEHEQVVQLPLNGRLFITLATLAPGVALPGNAGTAGALRRFPRINGGRPQTISPSTASPCCSRSRGKSRSSPNRRNR